jgi:signal transduction histidine kinase
MSAVTRESSEARSAVIVPMRREDAAERADELAGIARAICAVSGADRSVILAYDSMAEALYGVAGHGVNARAVESARFPMHESPLALRAAVSGLPAHAAEVSSRADGAVPLLGFRPLACLPLHARGRLVGVAYLDGVADATEPGRARLQDVALLAGLALGSTEPRGEASGADDRFARALHDGVLQTLCAIALEAGRPLEADNHASFTSPLAHILSLARTGMDDLREALAVLGGAAPARLGLALAVARLVTDVGTRSRLVVEVEIDDSLCHRDDAIGDALYRTCREGLANVVRHAGASRCQIRCGIEGGWAFATVEDDGVGSSGVTGPSHFGLMYLRGVLAGLGGEVEIRPRRPAGTTLLARAPLVGGGTDRPTG